MTKETKAVVDELERLLKVEKDYKKYQEKVSKIIGDRIRAVGRSTPLYKDQSTARVLGLLRSLQNRINDIKV